MEWIILQLIKRGERIIEIFIIGSKNGRVEIDSSNSSRNLWRNLILSNWEGKCFPSSNPFRFLPFYFSFPPAPLATSLQFPYLTRPFMFGTPFCHAYSWEPGWRYARKPFLFGLFHTQRHLNEFMRKYARKYAMQSKIKTDFFLRSSLRISVVN